ncbi:MAG: serine protease [Alphaproteobacteria bacterium]|nr:serine protease [Alphaproteobacteria bacterium]
MSRVRRRLAARRLYPHRIFLAVLAGATLVGSAAAQLLPPVGLPAPPVLGGVVGGIAGTQRQSGRVPVMRTLDTLGIPDTAASLSPVDLLQLRKLRLRELVRDHRGVLEMDDDDNPVRRGELLAIDPDPASLAAARRAGFVIIRDNAEIELGLRTIVLATPGKMSAREGLQKLRRAAPGIEADYNHLFEPAGGALMVTGAALAAQAGTGTAKRIAMIDGGVAPHPAFAGVAIEQRGFAGTARATGHGTAVASLLVGQEGRFSGAARGASLFVADVYGGDQAAGSAEAIVRALAWAIAKRPQVINISLAGPPNLLLKRAVEAAARRQIPIVAAVGNDGPAAPPQFPASYPTVVAVTGVDARDRALPEAGRIPSLAFAAPGADMAAALPVRDFARVRGTSFAAPLVAARLAAVGSERALAAEAVKGRGRVGLGIVCKTCRVDPKLVGAK